MSETFTSARHGLKDGDVVVVRLGRRKTLIELLTRPRVRIVRNVTSSTFETEFRRMTWHEWFAYLWRAIKPK